MRWNRDADHPGNPVLAAELAGQPVSAVTAHCDAVLAERGLPDVVFYELLADMAFLWDKRDTWRGVSRRIYGADAA